MSTHIRLASGLILCAMAAAPVVAQAHEATPAKESNTESTSSKMIVVRDTETGKLRAATGDEITALQIKESRLASLRRVSAEAPLQKAHASGAQGVRLTEEFMSHSVAVRAPNGKLVTKCLESKEEIEAFERRQATTTTTQIETE